MFCLDYAVAFFAHCSVASNFSESTQSHPLFTFPAGALAGGIAAVALYPFDIVRQVAVSPGHSSFAFSTIPFMTAYLGVYFLQPHSERRRKPLQEKTLWALGSTSVAAAVELPFDRAKINHGWHAAIGCRRERPARAAGRGAAVGLRSGLERRVQSEGRLTTLDPCPCPCLP